MVQNKGSPALMLTISSSYQCSLVITHYLAGGVKNVLEYGRQIKLEELFPLPEGQLPSKAQRLSLLGGDPTAPQRFFDRQIYLLLEHFLGWDTKAGKCTTPCSPAAFLDLGCSPCAQLLLPCSLLKHPGAEKNEICTLILNTPSCIFYGTVGLAARSKNWELLICSGPRCLLAALEFHSEIARCGNKQCSRQDWR